MIKFIISTNNSPPVTYCFEQATISIGAPSPTTDLPLSDESLQSPHIVISLSKSRYTATNVANDPFASLNELPFGKQQLHEGDILEIGDTKITINIEVEAEETVDLPTPTEEIDLEQLLQEVEKLESPSPPPQPQRTPSPTSLPTPIASPSVMVSTPATTTPETAPSSASTSPKVSLKDYYLSEYDDDEDTKFPIRERSSSQHWQRPSLHAIAKQGVRFLKTLFLAFTVIATVFAIFYFWLNEQSNEEEIRAAKGVADIAMGLTYAQLKHINPKNQNWADPDFLKKNITAVLALDETPLAEFDSHGQFSSAAYLLRIYTSHDLSQFLVIAQPSPSLIHWLIPKASIVVDSNVMEIRKIFDLKALNRLLVNISTLDEIDNKEIATVVEQGELIPLAELDNTDITHGTTHGFLAPKDLTQAHPGAENFIYNAPRYYGLGDSFINKCLQLDNTSNDSHEIASLQQELSAFCKFSHFVFYSTGGVDKAVESQKILSLLDPEKQFLTAYLQRNPLNKIVSTHLVTSGHLRSLVDDDEDSANDDEREEKETNHHDHLTLALATDGARTGIAVLKDPTNTRRDAPLALQLAALAAARQQALKPVADEITALLSKHAQEWQPNIEEALRALEAKYVEIDTYQKTRTLKKIETIAHNALTQRLAAADFIDQVKSSGLMPPLQQYLNSIHLSPETIDAHQKAIEELLVEIERSTDFKDLEQGISKILGLLTFSQIPDEEQLIAYQNQVRSRIIQKLNLILLSPKNSIPNRAQVNDYRQLLIHILDISGITDPETHSFYLREFEQSLLPSSSTLIN